MAQKSVIKNTGLRGVKVADTKVSFIDGEKGVLIYCSLTGCEYKARSD